MRCLPKPHLEGRKVAESVMVADRDIVSLAVPWTRDYAGDCLQVSPLSRMDLTMSASLPTRREEVTGEQYDDSRRGDQSHGRGIPYKGL
jgi:hypothetical protein